MSRHVISQLCKYIPIDENAFYVHLRAFSWSIDFYHEVLSCMKIDYVFVVSNS